MVAATLGDTFSKSSMIDLIVAVLIGSVSD